MTKRTAPWFVLLLLATLQAVAPTPSFARDPSLCPQSSQPQPSAAERQYTEPAKLLRCFLTREEIALVRGSRYHDAQESLNDPAFEGGKLNPDGTVRPVLEADQIDALGHMHHVLDPDMRSGAVIRKFIPNSDIGGFLYGRTVIGTAPSQTVVTTNAVRGFVGLERNTQGLDAGASIGALGLDYETTTVGQFTDASPLEFHREVAIEIRRNGLHSIRHRMSAQGAADAKIPLAKDMRDGAPTLNSRSIERNRQNQLDPYTGLGISDNLGLLTLTDADDEAATYPLRLNEEDVMTVPTPLALGDQILRRSVEGGEVVIARYVRGKNEDGEFVDKWRLDPGLSAGDRAYYLALIRAAAELVAQAGG